MAEQASLGLAGLLRQLRAEARLTQQELAKAAGVSPRSVSDLLFVAAARGRIQAAPVLAARRSQAPDEPRASAGACMVSCPH